MRRFTWERLSLCEKHRLGYPIAGHGNAEFSPCQRCNRVIRGQRRRAFEASEETA